MKKYLLNALIGFGAGAILCLLGYGLYQQTQLYPMLQQQIGYQRCADQVNAEIAKQKAAKAEISTNPQ